MLSKYQKYHYVMYLYGSGTLYNVYICTLYIYWFEHMCVDVAYTWLGIYIRFITFWQDRSALQYFPNVEGSSCVAYTFFIYVSSYINSMYYICIKVPYTFVHRTRITHHRDTLLTYAYAMHACTTTHKTPERYAHEQYNM